MFGLLSLSAAKFANAADDDAQGTQFLKADYLFYLKSDQAAIDALPEDIRNAKVLKVGGETTLAPYLFRKDGKITGIEADFMQALEKVLNVKIDVINTGFRGRQQSTDRPERHNTRIRLVFPTRADSVKSFRVLSSMVIGLLSNRVDVAMSDFSDTAEREEQVDFVDYTKTGQMLVVAKGNPLKIHNLADLCGHVAAGPTGSLSVLLAEQQSGKCVDEGKQKVVVKKYPSGADTYLALQAGRVDTTGIDYAIAVHQVEASNGELELAGELFAKGYHGAALPKNNQKLRDALL